MDHGRVGEGPTPPANPFPAWQRNDPVPISQPRVFLTAEWRSLAMVNYVVDPAILAPFVPAGTELDEFHGKVFVSMVGFLFLKTRVCGVPFPWHQNFEEVNLRFYVRRRVPGESGWRRGAVFIREIVPKIVIATVARVLYNEPYLACPMRHRVTASADATEAVFDWRHAGRWHSLAVSAEGGEPLAIAPGSEEEFITEHYWGYNKQRDGGTMEYAVEHPRWRFWRGRDYRFDCDVASLYGQAFVPFLTARASSAFVAEGAPVQVRQGRRLR